MSQTPEALTRLRRRIDVLDRQLLATLAERFEVVRKIGELKAEHGLETFQASRWEELLSTRVEQADALGLGQAFVKSFFHLIHEEALTVQRSNSKSGRTRRTP
jgi:chorismate mutase